MSADNWGICPKCKANTPKETVQLIQLGEAEYEHTLREDWEIGIFCPDDEPPRFEVIYKGRCECGFTYEHRHKENLT